MNKLSKEEIQASYVYKEWQNTLDNTNKIVTIEFLQTFEKIITLESQYEEAEKQKNIQMNKAIENLLK